MSWNPSPTSPLRSDASARPTTVPAALLTQAFIWMFAGLLLTAGVAAVVQTSSGLLEFTKSNFMLLIIGQLVVYSRSTWASTGWARPLRSACSSSTPPPWA